MDEAVLPLAQLRYPRSSMDVAEPPLVRLHRP
jgi:hypothetical protein